MTKSTKLMSNFTKKRDKKYKTTTKFLLKRTETCIILIVLKGVLCQVCADAAHVTISYRSLYMNQSTNVTEKLY